MLLLGASAYAQPAGYTVSTIVNNSQDPFLANPWGIARPGNPGLKENQWWISDNGTGLSTLYYANKQGANSLAPLIVRIPAANGTGPGSPTGIAWYERTFAFATLDGTISNWNAFTPGTGTEKCMRCHVTNATVMVNHSAQGASYQGLTITKNSISGAPTFYAANANGGVEAYDADSFSPVSLPPGAFTDPKIPAGYTPAGIQAIGARIYVTYNLHSGGGTGFVDAYDSKGDLVMRLQNGWFSQPWGVAQAPGNFGAFSNMILVGNTGSGWIGAYNPSNGKFQGFMKSGGSLITLQGLWGIDFGNGNADSGPRNVLYFAAGGANENSGVFGSIAAN